MKAIKVYELRDIFPRPICTFKTFKEVHGEEAQSKCFVCDHKFAENDDLYLAQFHKLPNKLICKDCWDKANEELGSCKNEDPKLTPCPKLATNEQDIWES